MEFASGDAVDARIGRFGVGIARRGDADDGVLQPHLLVDELEQGGDATVQPRVGVLHLHGTFAGAAVVVVAGIVGQRQQVGYAVAPDAALFQQPGGQQIDFVVDEGTGRETVELVLALGLKDVFEGLRTPVGQVFVVGYRTEGGPDDVLDAEIDGAGIVVLVEPLGELLIIGGAAPLPVLVVEPEGTVGRMAGTQDSRVAVGGDGVDLGVVAGGYLQLVGHGRREQLGGRAALVGIVAHVVGVVHTAARRQGGHVHPLACDDAVGGGRTTCEEGGGGRRAVGLAERHLGLAEHLAFAHEALEALFSIQRRERLQVVGAQLVDVQGDDQLGRSGQRLCLHAAEGQHQYGGNQSFLHFFCFVACLCDNIRLPAERSSKHSAKGNTAKLIFCGMSAQSTIKSVKTARFAII
ncbi:unknown [Bacteroides sp. CAG:661]|nr:unknown [Bacteroides sp. CAG:661]